MGLMINAALIAATNNNLFQGARVCPSKVP